MSNRISPPLIWICPLFGCKQSVPAPSSYCCPRALSNNGLPNNTVVSDQLCMQEITYPPTKSSSLLNPAHKPFKISTRSEDSTTCLLIRFKGLHDYVKVWTAPLAVYVGRKRHMALTAELINCITSPSRTVVHRLQLMDLYMYIHLYGWSIVNIIMSLSSGQLNDLPLIC